MTRHPFRLIAILGLLAVTLNAGCSRVVMDAARGSTSSFLSSLVNAAVTAAFDG
jgi:hypothetical protein